jgi:predicted O-methyltransferase YrrM
MPDGFIQDGYWFTQDWLEGRTAYWATHLRHLAARANLRFLEVGCFEGRATVWLLLNILTHPTARIDCVDIFDIEYEGAAEDYELRFDYNVLHCGAGEKVTKLRGPSQEILRQLPLLSYDCIYIDGSHAAVDVLQDAVLSFLLLKPKGILMFDDYEWEMKQDPLLKPRIAIDAFLKVYRAKYVLLEKAYQVIVKKV